MKIALYDVTQFIICFENYNDNEIYIFKKY